MAQPVNLNRYRKTKAWAEKKARADENAVKFGRSKGVKTRDRIQANKTDRYHDGHKREP
ncbi:protein of unknown function [Salinihabitans flavidus]|uniref:DUF4169 domain-containing protein n=1 Tax=Salinihabitans flavidus TaxID=569882 RepID=A0A1H8TDM1_9RHOB|nr:DUF4169 family protein [Salinihabitans flavidus]SEO88583.1 protein of unknown function [Salinihabitans flavidus]